MCMYSILCAAVADVVTIALPFRAPEDAGGLKGPVVCICAAVFGVLVVRVDGLRRAGCASFAGVRVLGLRWS
jgi:hypothetical protein